MKGNKNTFVRKINFKEETGMRKNNNAEIVIGLIGTIGTIAAPIVIDLWEDIRKTSDTKKIEIERKTTDDMYDFLAKEVNNLRGKLTDMTMTVTKLIIDNSMDADTMKEIETTQNILKEARTKAETELYINATQLGWYNMEYAIPKLKLTSDILKSAIAEATEHLEAAKYYAEIAVAVAAENKEAKIKALRVLKMLKGKYVPKSSIMTK